MKKTPDAEKTNKNLNLLTKESKNEDDHYAKINILMNYFDLWEKNLLEREQEINKSTEEYNKANAEKQKNTNAHLELQRLERELQAKQEKLQARIQYVENEERKQKEKKEELNKKLMEITVLENQLKDKERQVQELELARAKKNDTETTNNIFSLSDDSEIDIGHGKKPSKSLKGRKRTEDLDLERKDSELKEKEKCLKEVEKEIADKRKKVMEMWDQVIKKAENLKVIEKENEEMKHNLEEKEATYQERLRKLNEEREEFYKKYPMNSLEELLKSEKEREERERRIKEKESFLLKKTQEMDKREKEFYEKTKQVQEMLRALNQNIKDSNLPKEIQKNLLELSISETSRIEELNKQRTEGNDTYCSENLLDALLLQPSGNDSNVLREKQYYFNNHVETHKPDVFYPGKKSTVRDFKNGFEEDEDILMGLLQRKHKLMKDLNFENERKAEFLGQQIF